MIIKDQANNGQILNALKSYDELTDEEKEALIFAWTESKEDYANYQVRYNKHGLLLGVKGHDFSEKKIKELGQPHIDMVDSMQLLYGNKHSKAYQAAKKRAGVTNKQVNDARLVIKTSNNVNL